MSYGADPGAGIGPGLERIRILHWITSDSYLRARVASAAEAVETDVEIEALMAQGRR